MKLFGHNILIKLDEVEEKTASGIILSGDSAQAPEMATVKYIGMGIYSQEGTILPCFTKPGDKVRLGRNHGVKVEIDGEEYRMIAESSLLGIL